MPTSPPWQVRCSSVFQGSGVCIMGSTYWELGVHALPPTYCVILGKFLSLSGPYILQLYIGGWGGGQPV